MADASDTTDDGGIGPDVSRRSVLALLGAVGAGAAGLGSSQEDSGLGALGGAEDDQAVPVEDILVVLGDEEHVIASGDSESYDGIDVRQGGELAFEHGAEIALNV